jgi:ABC-type enterobactin transport system permease subunit
MDVQTIRLIDVFFIAPVLIYAAGRKELSEPLRLTILGIGIATLVYNGHNYLKAKENA